MQLGGFRENDVGCVGVGKTFESAISKSLITVMPSIVLVSAVPRAPQAGAAATRSAGCCRAIRTLELYPCRGQPPITGVPRAAPRYCACQYGEVPCGCSFATGLHHNSKARTQKQVSSENTNHDRVLREA
ncbi:hypothetical protein E2C01_047437 [Portunus trituberculatus]|uniref:Uncharacterized protein n=1 Tax=Portunus trituberculatus TaxID=210409 RepID=A0A5B7G8J6_PORTR|nr:hypothetical protein [Portunus trituberculatus]